MANQVTVHEKGFTVLHEAPNPGVDIVFVHGFTGHPRLTWTMSWGKVQTANRANRKKHDRDDELPDGARRPKIPRLPFLRQSPSPAATSSTPQSSQTSMANEENGGIRLESEKQLPTDIYWPADLAPETIPESQILTYGYDTHVRHWIAGPHYGEKCRPILFVAHSLGGIVVKAALRRAGGCESTKPHLHNIFKVTAGALFFGTPHGGADPRGFLHHVLSVSAQALGVQVNKQIVSTLMPDAERLAELRDEFTVMCHERKWHVYSFQEEYGVSVLFQRKVVDDHSSCLNNAMVETKQHISSNHMDICRFSGLQDPEYRKVAAAITFILGGIGQSTENLSLVPPLARTHSQVTYPIMNDEHISRAPSIAGAQSPHGPSPQGIGASEDDSQTVGDSAIPADIKQALIEELYFEKIDERLTSLTPAQSTTCRWFFAKDEYISWREPERQPDHGGFLWIKGHPGTGKSTLMKLLFEEAKLSSRGDPLQITLSFFFLARGTLEEKSTTGLYRSLLHKLFEAAPDLKESLEWITADGARGMLRNGWQKEALKQTLTHAIRKLGRRSLTIFVDALDECNDDEAEDMIFFFEDLCELAQGMQAQLRICFSSRHYPHIEIKKGVSVILEDEVGQEEDIKHYIKSKLRLRMSKQAESLQSEILEKSSLIFLWVVLVIDILNSEYPGKPIEKMRKRLREIPKKLADLFEMILTRDRENPEVLQLCLQWILFATRPLKPQELYFAVHFGFDKECSGRWDQEAVDSDALKTFVRSSSKGLAEVTRNKASEVQFIHESVRDFLLGKYSGQWSEAASSNFEGHGHQVLRDCCLAQVFNTTVYIPDDSTELTAQLRDDVRLMFPFLEYAVLNVLRHANSAQRHGKEQSDFLGGFPVHKWRILNNAMERFEIRRHGSRVTLLYILAEKNLAALIKVYPRVVSCFDYRIGNERYGPPIFAALATGSDDAVQALLEVQARAEPPAPPLHELCKQYPERKRMKLRYDFVFSKRKGVAHYIHQHGDLILLVFLLILTRLNVNCKFPDGSGKPLLWNAVEQGQDDMARILVRNGAEVNIRDKRGTSLLWYAVSGNREGIVKVLLEEGADPKFRNSDYSPDTSYPLFTAIRRGNYSIVKLLLEHGAELESMDADGWTPLGYATSLHHHSIIKLLLEHGADIEGRTSDGRTALGCAAVCGHNLVAGLLLELGAEVDAKDPGGGSPLLNAAVFGHGAVARLLLENNAVVDLPDNHGRTPLFYAAYNGRTAVVLLLLEKGARADLADNEGHTPLSVAAQNGHEVVTELLTASLETH